MYISQPLLSSFSGSPYYTTHFQSESVFDPLQNVPHTVFDWYISLGHKLSPH